MRIFLRLLTLVFFLAVSTAGCMTEAPTQAPIIMATGPFTLTITSPADQAVVAKPGVELRGKVSDAAVLTLNDDTYLLKAGAFTETVQLQEGINAVQIVASDMDGNEVDLILTVTYQP
jgi:Glucodextranase, domain B